MYFIVDLLLLIILVFVIVASVKFGFTRNFIFGILKTIIGFAGAIGACVGVYFLMNHFGWLDYLSDAVVGFFGNVSNPNAILNDDTFRIVAKIIAYIPFGILFIILGYLFVNWFMGILMKGIFLPIFYARKHVKAVKIIDNVLGLILNLGIYVGILLVAFGFVHGINSVNDGEGEPVYDKLSMALFNEDESFIAETVNKFTGPMFNKWHESLTASPIGSIIYTYNPLNGVFEGVVEGMFGVEN